MYKLLGSTKSRAFRVLWALEEIGAPYEFQPASPRSPEVVEFNPSGKIPVLIEDGVPIIDSTAIMTFVTDRAGALTFPAGTIERAQQDAFTNTILDEVDAILWMASRHSFILPEDQRVPEVKPSLRLEFGRNVSRITEAMKGPYLMGEMMTVPDIILTHCCTWAKVAKFPDLPDPLLAYVSAMRKRPAYQRVMEIGS